MAEIIIYYCSAVVDSLVLFNRVNLISVENGDGRGKREYGQCGQVGDQKFMDVFYCLYMAPKLCCEI